MNIMPGDAAVSCTDCHLGIVILMSCNRHLTSAGFVQQRHAQKRQQRFSISGQAVGLMSVGS